MKVETVATQQDQVVSLVAVTATELLKVHDYEDLIDPRTIWTQPVLTEAGLVLGEDIYKLMQPTDEQPLGIHQRHIEALRITYGEQNKKYGHLVLGGTEVAPIDHVTNRLGKKATHVALSEFNKAEELANRLAHAR